MVIVWLLLIPIGVALVMGVGAALIEIVALIAGLLPVMVFVVIAILPIIGLITVISKLLSKKGGGKE